MLIDLSKSIDDKILLPNPHKGWYIHYVDNGLCRTTYRDGIAEGDFLEDFPGLNHLYLRLDWSDIEPTEGEFDWSFVDSVFASWGAKGYRFSFRFCCFETSNPYATPEWVRLAGAKGSFIERKSASASKPLWEPDYGDPVFLEKLNTFLGRCAEKLDGHPLVEFVDVGSFGTWGEGHTFSGSGRAYSADVLRRHIDLHLKHFVRTPLLLNDDICNTAKIGGASSFAPDGDGSARALAEYCAAKGMGARDDSVCVDFFSRAFGYDTLRSPDFFDYFSRYGAPVDIELQHYHMVGPEVMKSCLPFLEALKRSHASFAGFHGYPRPWLEKFRDFTEYAANRMGYWYFLTALDLPECVSGLKSIAGLHVENRGFAPAYRPYTLKLRAVGDGGEYPLHSSDGLNLGWVGEHIERLTLDFAGVPAGEYELQLGLFDGDIPIRFAMRESEYVSGWHRLAKISVSDIG